MWYYWSSVIPLGIKLVVNFRTRARFESIESNTSFTPKRGPETPDSGRAGLGGLKVQS